MNRSTVEKQIERVMGELGKYPPASEMNSLVVRELEALTELLAHYPKWGGAPGTGGGCVMACGGNCPYARASHCPGQKFSPR